MVSVRLTLGKNIKTIANIIFTDGKMVYNSIIKTLYMYGAPQVQKSGPYYQGIKISTKIIAV